MKSGRKKQILQMLARNLEMFHPEHKNSFMCPTCLKVIPITNVAKIVRRILYRNRQAVSLRPVCARGVIVPSEPSKTSGSGKS